MYFYTLACCTVKSGACFHFEAPGTLVCDMWLSLDSVPHPKLVDILRVEHAALGTQATITLEKVFLGLGKYEVVTVSREGFVNDGHIMANAQKDPCSGGLCCR